MFCVFLLGDDTLEDAAESVSFAPHTTQSTALVTVLPPTVQQNLSTTVSTPTWSTTTASSNSFDEIDAAKTKALLRKLARHVIMSDLCEC